MNSDKGKPELYIPPHRRRRNIEASKDSIPVPSEASKDSIPVPSEASKDSIPVPSETNDSEYVTTSCVENAVEDREEWMACGKWIWYNIENNPAHLDQVWKELQHYLSDGTFIQLMATTAATAQLEGGAVFCFTKPEKEAIKRAAKAIRSVTKDDTILHYKVNLLSELNIYRRYGYKNISHYKFTAKGRFYRRDHLHRWILDEDSLFENKLVCKSCTGNLRLEQLPSNADNNKLDLKHSTYFDKDGSTGCWNIKCDNSNRHECGWTEADRIWASATKLYEEHIFARIVCFRKARVAYISCYVTSISNIESLTSCIRKVTQDAQYVNPVYFYVYNESSDEITWKYKLTAEEEFYEMFCDNGVTFQKFIM